MWFIHGPKDYVKYDGHNVKPVNIFLSGNGSTSKSHLVKVIYDTISKTFLYHCKDPEKPRWTFRNISSKFRAMVLGYQRLSEIKFLIIDEFSMVSSDLWTDLESRWGEIRFLNRIYWSFSYDYF